MAIRQLNHSLESLHTRELAAIAANEQVDRQIDIQHLTASAYADALENKVLPPWQSLYRDAAVVHELNQVLDH